MVKAVEMVETVDIGTAGAPRSVPAYASRNTAPGLGAPLVAELVAAAIARLRGDLEMYRPSKPAIAYALAGETHAAMLQRWRQHSRAVQAALLAAFLTEASELMRQIHARIARIAPSHGYMFGLQDEAIKLEAQADITLEEIRRIEAELNALRAGEALQ